MCVFLGGGIRDVIRELNKEKKQRAAALSSDQGQTKIWDLMEDTKARRLYLVLERHDCSPRRLSTLLLSVPIHTLSGCVDSSLASQIDLPDTRSV